MNIRTLSRRLGVAALAFLVVGCSSDDDPPVTATVIVEASASAEQALTLVLSSRFEVDTSGEVIFINADTVQITGDYEDTIALNSEARFTAKLLNEYETEEPVRLSVFIDESSEYDQIATLGQGGFLQYIYRFQLVSIF